MISEYERLGGHFPEEIEWQIREFALPKYRKPLNKQTLIRLNSGIRQNQCDEVTQYETLKKWIWHREEAEYGGWLGWYEAMVEEYGPDVDFAEFEVGLEREVKNTLNLLWNDKLDAKIWNSSNARC
tara:strand:+ start:201 stop:578 length:378 start_codon:yes stop_codon:yes gene_type:complete